MKSKEVAKTSAQPELSHALDSAFGIWAFRHAFEKRRLDPVAEDCLQFLPAEIMGLRPAAIGAATEIDEANLLLGVLRLLRRIGKKRERFGQCNDRFLLGSS